MSTIPERLQQLRTIMEQEKVQAYVVCTDDFHGSEYVGSYFKMRAFLSGFTGSAGTLVVLQDEACLWTDGRYFLQAGTQLAGTTVTLMKIGEPGVPTIPEYLAEKLNKGDVIGFDGRTVTSSFVKQLEEKVKEKEITFAWDKDLADAIWTDRPELARTAIWELDAAYTGMTREEKLEKVREKMAESKADVFVLTALDDIAWLLNLRADDVQCNPVFLSYMIIEADQAALYVDDSRMEAAIKEKLEKLQIRVCPYNAIYEDLKELPQEKCIWLDGSVANYMVKMCIPQNVTILDKKSPITLLKACKTPQERENIKKAHIKDGVAVTHFMYWLKQNIGKIKITELSAAKKLEEFRAAQEDYLGSSFTPIMGFAEHGAIVHYSATEESDAVLEPRSFLLADTGGQYLQGTTDITRTFVLGELTEEEKKMFTLVLRGHLNLRHARFLYGTRGVNLDYLAREPLWENDLDYNHGTGHGVGFLLNVHEAPQRIHWRIADGTVNNAVLEDGMVTSNEPGIYLTGKFGIRHENLVLCQKGTKNEYGQFMYFENLTMVPFDPAGVDVSYMSDKDVERFNAYQKEVYDAISPYFEGEEKAWLEKITAPLKK